MDKIIKFADIEIQKQKFSKSLKKDFDSEPVYGEKHLKAKISFTIMKYQEKVLNLLVYH